MFHQEFFSEPYFAEEFFPDADGGTVATVQTISTTGDARNFFRISGRLCLNPTDLSTAYPHGGSDLGKIRNGVFHFHEVTPVISAEEFGGATVDYVWQGYRAVLACVLREWDPDALAEVFPNTSTGASSGRTVLNGQVFGTTAETPPGSLISTRGSKMLVSARDPWHPSILIYEALPLLQDSSRLQISIGEDVGIAVAFRAVHNSSGNTFQIGLLEDLTL